MDRRDVACNVSTLQNQIFRCTRQKKSKKIYRKICFSPARCIIFAHAETKMSYQKHFSTRHHTLTLSHPHTFTPILADVAQLVERNLAKVEVAGSNLVIRSKRKLKTQVFGFLFLFLLLPERILQEIGYDSCTEIRQLITTSH